MLNAIHEEGEDRLEAFLSNSTDRDVLYSRFEAYRPFAEAYQCPLDCTGNNSADRRVELAEGRAIRFVRLNSALICTKDRKEHGHLLLGQRQRILEERPGEELVVLMHHPLGWISDADDMSRFLHGRARVCMSGHEHLAAVEVRQIEPGCDLMMIAAGATTPDAINDTYTYAYNVIQFDWDDASDSLAVTLFPRRWNDGMKRFEADDARLGTQDQRIVLGSPYFCQAPRPAPTQTGEPTAPEAALVEIIVPQEEAVTTGGQVDETEYQNLYMRFFRDLAEGDRLRILVALGAVPAGMTARFNHETESKLLRSIVRVGRFDDLKAKVEEALANRPQSRGEEE